MTSRILVVSFVSSELSLLDNNDEDDDEEETNGLSSPLEHLRVNRGIPLAILFGSHSILGD